MTTLWLGRRRLKLDPQRAIGKGGEADVFDIGGGRVLKRYKSAQHPDLAGLPDEQLAATARLAERATKLRSFPTGLPPEVVLPEELCCDAERGGQVVGFSMRRFDGEPLASLVDLRQRTVPGALVPRRLVQLGQVVSQLHARGVVIGDFNDLNVLVTASTLAVIDADSFQWGAFRCTTYTERFVDPLLCSSAALAPIKPHSIESDWYAFSILVMQSLLGVGPYGGVHPLPAAARTLARITVFDKTVRYPRPALPLASLPGELVAVLQQIFVEDRRGPFPLRLLEALHETQCAACSRPSYSGRCPACQPPTVAVSLVRGRVTARRASARLHAAATPRVWEQNGQLWTESPIGPVVVGDVLPERTRFWAGAQLGFGFYRASELCVAFVFQPGRRGLNDSIALPLRGQLMSCHAVLGERVWFGWQAQEGPYRRHHLVVIDRAGVVRAHQISDEAPAWSIAGACAVGAALLAPGDEGLVRIAEQQGQLVIRSYPDTVGLVDSASRLSLAEDCLIVEGRDGRWALTLDTNP